jgi:predicted SprT family Zn-dependent metalloprotease
MANAKLSTNQQTSIMAVDKENTNPSRRNVGDATFKTVTTGIASSSSSSCNYNNKNGTLEGPSLLDAITNKKTISLSVSNQNHNLCGDDCNSEDPILEIDEDDDENNSFYGADDKNINSSSSSSDDDNNPNQSVLFVEDSDDEESILLVSVKKMPRKKTFVLDSDEEEDDMSNSSVARSPQADIRSDKEAEKSSRKNTAKNFESSDFSLSSGHGSEDSSRSERSAPPVTRNNPTRRTKSAAILLHNDIISDSESNDDDEPSSSEEEWNEEMSPDGKEQKQPRAERLNTVIILSDDDEYDSESDSEVGDDEQSAFTISDDDAGSDDSDASSFCKDRTKKAHPPPRMHAKSPRAMPSKSATLTTSSKPQQNMTRLVNFNKYRDSLTSKTFTEFNKLAFADQLSYVKVEWSKKLNSTAGLTRMKGKLGDQHADTRTASIELATKVIESEEQLRSTLLHEMCHAAAWLVDGVHKPPHGKVFKQWASKSMQKIKDVKVTTTHDYQITYKFAWACTNSNCKVVIKRHSRSIDTSKHCCGKCKNKLVEIEVPGKGEDISNNAFTPKKQRKTSDFALFVKKHSANIRGKLAKERSCSSKDVSQADVMKECGKEWQLRKQGGSSNDIDGLGAELINLTLG